MTVTKKLKTLPAIDAALRKRVELSERRGREYNPVIPPLLHPKHVERKYTRVLQKSFTKLFEMVRIRLSTRLPEIMDKAARELETTRFDAADDDLRTIINGILVEFGRELTQNEVKAIAARRGLEVSEYNRLQNTKVYKKVLGVDVFQDEPWLSDALERFSSENAALITTLSERHVNEVRAIVVKGMREGTPAVELAGLIRNKVNRRTRANYKLIARDQVSKLNGQLTELRQKSVGVEEYIWRDSRDERVRGNPGGRYPNAKPSHWENNGKKFRWSEAPATGHPGSDYQCRCYAEPVLRGLIE